MRCSTEVDSVKTGTSKGKFQFQAALIKWKSGKDGHFHNLKMTTQHLETLLVT